jgi:sulfide:quinone oxidoreductase
MSHSRAPFNVVIAGAGVAALEAALALRDLAEGLVSVVLVAPETEFVYRPLAVAEPFGSGEVRRFPLSHLAEAAGASLRKGTIVHVNPDDKCATTAEGEILEYDAFVLAVGAATREAVPGALTFSGPADVEALAALLDRATAGEFRRLAFVLPAGASWPLPIYELALLTAEYLSDRGTRGVETILVTPEERPLAMFGGEASDAIAELLQIRGIELHSGVAAVEWRDGTLVVAGGSAIDADAAVALARLVGPALPRLPHDGGGFVPTDSEGRVIGAPDVYAAGDATQMRPKQGGLAAQQADAVAAAIAADAGADVQPMPFRPVLRGLLLTGFVPRYLRVDRETGRSRIDTEPLWWPPAKIVGRYLAPFLALQLGLEDISAPPEGVEGVQVDLPLDPPVRAS